MEPKPSLSPASRDEQYYVPKCRRGACSTTYMVAEGKALKEQHQTETRPQWKRKPLRRRYGVFIFSDTELRAKRTADVSVQQARTRRFLGLSTRRQNEPSNRAAAAQVVATGRYGSPDPRAVQSPGPIVLDTPAGAPRSMSARHKRCPHSQYFLRCLTPDTQAFEKARARQRFGFRTLSLEPFATSF